MNSQYSFYTSVTMPSLLPSGDIGAILDEFISESSVTNAWTDATVRMVRVLKSHILRFGEAAGPDYFDREGLDRFVSYLRTETQMKESSCRKQYMNLRWFLGWACRKGYCTQSASLGYTPKFKIAERPVIFLTPEELNALYNLSIPREGSRVTLKDFDGRLYRKTVRNCADLDLARDLFCFCAFTSLRYSDMAALRRSDIRDGTLSLVMRKTGTRVRIELGSQAKAILARYQSSFACCRSSATPDGKVFPPIGNQRMNALVRELCELAMINNPVASVCYRAGRREESVLPKWARVTTHAARRTFICFALAQGIPPQVVMKWTGHSDYKAMKPYIDVAEKTRSEAMDSLSAAWRASLGG